ncbi:MAG: hypothetical protein AB1715_06120, partial [Acidobacteriota bacterium]
MSGYRLAKKSVSWMIALGSLLLLLVSLQAAQQPSLLVKKPLTYDAYDSWMSIRGTQLSQDGTWLAYALVPQDADGELVVRNLRTAAEFRSPRGKDP